MIVRTSDHGELGLSHGGLRQKMFNAYEESIRVPLVVSNPVLFPEARESDALVSLVDLVPTFLGLAGAAPEPDRFDGHDLGPLLRGEADQLREAVLFTYDDHQAATAFQEVAGQPNRIRCVRDRRWKYAIYLDPAGDVAPEYELYDLETRPRRGAQPRRQAHGSRPDRAGRARAHPHARPARAAVRRHRHAHAGSCRPPGARLPCMAETPTLYVCHGDDGGPRIHPCRRVQEALRAAGIEYDKVIAAHGNPIPFLRKGSRDELRAATGQTKLPALKLADGTVITPSKAILSWIAEQK